VSARRKETGGQAGLLEEPSPPASAREIVQALEIRHSKGLVVTECKDGPTQTGTHVRLDVWAMARSWAHPCLDGYEVKVSRGDFLRDQKMHNYLRLCNRLWVACPRRMIAPGELPQEIGLIYVTPGAARVQVAKRAPFRQIDPPVDLLNYVLMCRARIEREYVEPSRTREERLAFWREWLAGKREMRDVAFRVSSSLREQIRHRIADAEERAAQAERRAAATERGYADAAALFKELGIEPNGLLVQGAPAHGAPGRRRSGPIGLVNSEPERTAANTHPRRRFGGL
jgi:hypothetical protein